MPIHSLVYLITRRCPNRCDLCAPECGPDVKGAPNAKQMLGIADDIYPLGALSLIVFTGGEPFLEYDEMLPVIRWARARGIVSRIVTSAYWASTYDRAFELLQGLKKAGLYELNYSVDDFHVKYVPLEKVKHAVDAAMDLDIPLLIAMKGLRETSLTPEKLSEFLGREMPRYERKTFHTDKFGYDFGTTVPIGHNQKEYPCSRWLISLRKSQMPAFMHRCPSIMERIIIDPDGYVVPCCGMIRPWAPHFKIGNVFESSILDIVLNASNDLILNWLAIEGPYGLMQFIKKIDPSIPFLSAYVNHCHLCDDIFTRDECFNVLMEHAQVKRDELTMMRGFVEGVRDLFISRTSANQ